jgi:hypothetical protein
MTWWEILKKEIIGQRPWSIGIEYAEWGMDNSCRA